jgi:pyridoxal phosphate enzyme (YggS family)
MIKENYQKLISELPQNVKLIAVSKTHGPDRIMQLYNLGHRAFGENKVQELVGKYKVLPKDLEWHLIGHLQSNKVKYVAPFVSLIQSVDSEKLLEAINREAAKNNRIIPCLLQIHIASEETKFGFSTNELLSFLDSGRLTNYKNVSINGLMGMATNTDDKEKVRMEFKSLNHLFKKLQDQYFREIKNFNILSMGMSGDYHIAIEEGSSMIRIGSLIFGEREYK